MQRMKIGEIANAAGVTTKTIRYYEAQGLLDEPDRTDSGYRMYDERAVERLEFIGQAKRLGLSLEEIRGVLALHRQKEAPCVHVLALLDEKINRAEEAIQELSAFRRGLKALRDESRTRLDELPEDAKVCGIIERGVHEQGKVALAWLEASGKKPKARTREDERVPRH